MFGLNVTMSAAFGAGILSFFSPCLLPMIPAYIMYITGVEIEEDLSKRRLKALIRTLFFVLGFTIVFMIMGTSASFIGRLFAQNKMLFLRISGIIIVIFGLNMMGILKIGALSGEKRIRAPKKITNWFSSILMGMAFAGGWTPCFGPVLASILVMAGGAKTIQDGVLLLFIYSVGMAIPFIFTALFINVFIRFMEKYERFMKHMPFISGIILIIFGMLIFFDKMIDISRLLL